MLSVIIPVYNEKNTIKEIINRILALPLKKELIIVNDASNDGTKEILDEFSADNITVIHHEKNQGKGRSLLEGAKKAKGVYLIIQDADLEYNPEDYVQLFDVLEKDQADIAYGARFFLKRSGMPMHRLGNQVLTGMLNFLFSSNLNDYATCYKMFKRDVFNQLKLKARGFDIDVEITCKALKKGLRLKEVPISYYPRNFSEGKKIRFVDGLWAMFYMLKYRFSK